MSTKASSQTLRQQVCSVSYKQESRVDGVSELQGLRDAKSSQGILAPTTSNKNSQLAKGK